jgi:hypothetical protein
VALLRRGIEGMGAIAVSFSPWSTDWEYDAVSTK